LLLDDVRPPEEHPLRELMFHQALFLEHGAGTYLQTMQDEVHRLAYVALTRARLGVMWVPLLDTPPMAGTSQTSFTVSEHGCFILVKNFVQRTGRL
jgi:hypothetical protein